jgi:hypothetical protein
MEFLVFHPQLHVFAADGLFDEQGRLHSMPGESLAPVTALFRHCFLNALRAAKLISAQKFTELPFWKHSGFHIDGGEKPVAPGDTKGRQRLAEYLLRAPFSLQKIHWNPKTHTVLYRSRHSWKTKRNFEVFKATGFLAAAECHRPRNAPALARPHPPGMGCRSPPVSGLQGHPASRRHVPPLRRNRILPAAPWTLGGHHRPPPTNRSTSRP